MKQGASIGEMDELISILHSTENTDLSGGISVTWQVLAQNIWASVENKVQSDEGQEGEQIVALNLKSFTIWYRDDITEKMRVLWMGKEYDIVTVDMLGRKIQTRIEAQARDNRT